MHPSLASLSRTRLSQAPALEYEQQQSKYTPSTHSSRSYANRTLRVGHKAATTSSASVSSSSAAAAASASASASAPASSPSPSCWSACFNNPQLIATVEQQQLLFEQRMKREEEEEAIEEALKLNLSNMPTKKRKLDSTQASGLSFSITAAVHNKKTKAPPLHSREQSLSPPSASSSSSSSSSFSLSPTSSPSHRRRMFQAFRAAPKIDKASSLLENKKEKLKQKQQKKEGKTVEVVEDVESRGQKNLSDPAADSSAAASSKRAEQQAYTSNSLSKGADSNVIDLCEVLDDEEDWFKDSIPLDKPVKDRSLISAPPASETAAAAASLVPKERQKSPGLGPPSADNTEKLSFKEYQTRVNDISSTFDPTTHSFVPAPRARSLYDLLQNSVLIGLMTEEQAFHTAVREQAKRERQQMIEEGAFDPPAVRVLEPVQLKKKPRRKARWSEGAATAAQLAATRGDPSDSMLIDLTEEGDETEIRETNSSGAIEEGEETAEDEEEEEEEEELDPELLYADDAVYFYDDDDDNDSDYVQEEESEQEREEEEHED